MGTAAKWDVLTTLASNNRGVANATSANSSGTTIDLLDYINVGGRQMKAVLNVGTVTSTGNLSVRLQESSTSAEAGFSDISGAVFTTTASSASLTGSETIHFRTNNRYVRAVGAAANTAQVNYGVYIMAEKRLA